MDRIAAYKGIAPGKIISRAIKKQGITQREVASRAGIHYQTLNAIITGKREITLRQSIDLDRVLGFETGFFAVIQTYYSIDKLTAKSPRKIPHPDIRPYVFWDIDMDTLDWEANKAFIIQRVNERGNKTEIELIRNYYEPKDE